MCGRYEEGGARGQRGRRHEWQGLSKVRMRGGHLSKVVQQQLAVFLESVIEGSKPGSEVRHRDLSVSWQARKWPQCAKIIGRWLYNP